MPSYFKRHYLNDVKLAQRALLEFDRSLRSGRMIAFTGSMTTESRGYGTWDELVDAYARIGSHIVDWIKLDRTKEKWEEICNLNHILNKSQLEYYDPIKKAIDYRVAVGGRFDPRVVLGVVEEAVLEATATVAEPIEIPPLVGGDGELDRVRTPIDLLSVMAARYFRSPQRAKHFEDSKEILQSEYPKSNDDVVVELAHALGIRRFATLNYDFELEAQLMLHADKEKQPFRKLRQIASKGIGLSWDPDSGRIRRVLISGHAVESDILNRERIDRMLEFAIGADD